MFKKLKSKFRNYRKSKLQITPGESIRDSIIESSIQAAYAAGNSTEKIGEVASTVKDAVDGGVALFGGGEASTSLGKIVFKAGKDVARGDTVCTGLCCVSATCESVAVLCSTVKVIPFRGRIYVGVKILSKGCMTYRNLCAGENC